VLGAYQVITNYLFADLLNSMDLAKELELLQQNRALGGPKHHRDVVEMMEGIRQMLADIVYCWAAQSGFPREPTLRFVEDTFFSSRRLL